MHIVDERRFIIMRIGYDEKPVNGKNSLKKWSPVKKS